MSASLACPPTKMTFAAFDVAMDQPVVVQMAERRSERQPEVQTLVERKPAALFELTTQRPRLVVFRVNPLAAMLVVRQFHHIVEIAVAVIAPYVGDRKSTRL